MPTLVKKVDRVELNQKEAKTYPPDFKYRIRVADDAAYLLTPYGEEIIVDLEDLERVRQYRWFFNDDRIYTRKDRTIRQTSLPKFILELSSHRRVPISFRNGNIWDNRKNNLITNNEDVKSLRESGQQLAARQLLDYLEDLDGVEEGELSPEELQGYKGTIRSVDLYIRRTFL